MSEPEITPLRRTLILAWALHQGYEATQASWYDEEGVEAWEWTGPDGLEIGGQIGSWDEAPTMPDDLFDRLNAECRWHVSV